MRGCMRTFSIDALARPMAEADRPVSPAWLIGLSVLGPLQSVYAEGQHDTGGHVLGGGHRPDVDAGVPKPHVDDIALASDAIQIAIFGGGSYRGGERSE